SLTTPGSSVLANPLVVSNSASVAPNASVVLNFNNVPLGSSGSTNFRAVVALTGDTNAANDTALAASSIATTLTSFPQTEDAESTLPVVKWISVISGSRNLWTLRQGKYANSNMPDSLSPAGGNAFFLADCWSGTSSVGFRSRLYSECLQIPTQSGGLNYNLAFQMSQDDKFATDLDSIYVMIGTNGGTNWTSIGGFQRYNAAFTTPGWVTNNLSLAAYAGQTIQIGFDAVSKFGNIIGIDNVVVTANAALPVTFSNFTGNKRGNVNDLVWVTANETNNAGFEIERSADGRTFSKIAFVATKATNGTSNQSISYTATDAFILAGTNHYRLKQIDKDGKFNYSAVVTIAGNKPGKLSLGSVYPNPAVDVVNLQIATPNTVTAQILVMSTSGKIVGTHSKGLAVGDNLVTIPVQNLAKGTYFIKVIDNNGDYTNTVQFVK
ncbi:MAG: T9SS C-terminal target domain-containing protein, partial [Bacteroidetes bacterium]